MPHSTGLLIQTDPAAFDMLSHTTFAVLNGFYWIIQVEWCIYASVIYATIGSANGLSTIRYQTIILTNTGQCNFSQNTTIFIEVDYFENVICKMAVTFVDLNALNQFL